MYIENTVGESTEEIYSYSDFSNVMMSYVMTTFRVVCVAVPALGKPCLLISLFLLFCGWLYRNVYAYHKHFFDVLQWIYMNVKILK